jgi:hypothetical protein
MRSLLVIIGLLLAGIMSAQNYTRDAGIRVGDYFSATARLHVKDDEAIEAMLFIGRHGSTATILKEYFQPAFSSISEYLYFEYGFGAHIGFRYIDRYQILNRTYVLDEQRFTPLLGLNGIIGLEYRFHNFPVIVGTDFKPYFEYSTIQIFSVYLKSVGISIKYRF